MQIASRKLDWLDPVNADFHGSKKIPAMEKNTNLSGDWILSKVMYCKIIQQRRN